MLKGTAWLLARYTTGYCTALVKFETQLQGKRCSLMDWQSFLGSAGQFRCAMFALLLHRMYLPPCLVGILCEMTWLLRCKTLHSAGF